MSKPYHIETMNREEMNVAIEWAAREGWNPGLYDADCFYPTDPQGFFAGKINNSIVAIGSAVIYDENFAFCGFYIVSPPYRGNGFGLALTKHRLAYIGSRNAGLDGVSDMLEKYARLGYRVAYNNARYSAAAVPYNLPTYPAIMSLDNCPFSSLVDYDRYHFPAKRPVFLQKWISQPQGKALGWIDEGKLHGYGVMRKCREGFKMGPLFADSPFIAEQLFLALAAHAKGHSLYLDIAENNPEALALVQRYQMEKIFETSRMYLRGEPELKTNNIYGITTFELG